MIEYKSPYEQGYDAHGDGSSPSPTLTEQELKEWYRGWRTAEEREWYILER
jgi:hypothetical protein